MDAILIANESVDVRNISNIPGILCKLDVLEDVQKFVNYGRRATLSPMNQGYLKSKTSYQRKNIARVLFAELTITLLLTYISQYHIRRQTT